MNTRKITLREGKYAPTCTHFCTSSLVQFPSSGSSHTVLVHPSAVRSQHCFRACFCPWLFSSRGCNLPSFWLRAQAMVSGWLWPDIWALRAAAEGDLKATLVVAVCRWCVRSLAQLQMCLSALWYSPQKAQGHVTYTFSCRV